MTFHRINRICVRHSIAPSLVAIATFAASLGCTSEQQTLEDRASVTGIVAIDGQPIGGGTITFYSVDNPNLQAKAPLRPGGKYMTDRAPIGPSTVSVETESVKFGNASAFVAIPVKYNDPNASGLTAELKPGVNENVNFALEK